jgi:deazaflavin-dependent oxidoreductase (nitroreductase family)
MSSTHAPVQAGRPGISRPIRALAKPLGPLARPLAGHRWLPLYAVLHHLGRTSGTAYATPVVALRAGDGFLIPLPFGDATQWAKNLIAADGGSLRFAGHDYRIAAPRIADLDEARHDLPRIVGFLTRRLGLRHFVRVTAERR